MSRRREAREIGDAAVALTADVAAGADIAAVVAKTIERFGVPDIVINNAGYTHRNQPLLEVDEASFDRVFAMNVKSIFNMVKAVVPAMRDNGGGVILNIGSVAGIRPRPGLTWYNGRRAGVMLTVGGAGICSALTALIGTIGVLPLILIRSVSGLGYGEQGVNGAYLSELYSAADDDVIVRWRGRIYSIVQGGWPVGALLAALLTSLLLPKIGWKGCFVFAAVPSIIVAVLARRLRETPQFEGLTRQSRAARETARGGLLKLFASQARRPALVLGAAHLLNWFTVQVFAILGTTVLVDVHHITFTNSLLVLILSNIWGFIGYLVHGYFGDKFGRRNVIAVGWSACGVAFAAMLFVPSSFWTVVALYSIGQFFLVGPYSCMLLFVDESFPESSLRGTGSSFVVGIGAVGAILAGLAATAMLHSGYNWQLPALYFGAIPSVLSGLCVLLAKPVGTPAARPAVETNTALAAE